MKIKVLIIVLVCAAFFLEGINIFLSNNAAGTSFEVSKLQQDLEVLQEHNTSLKTDLLSYSSYDHISSRAAELGFKDTKNSAIMLSAPLQVALSH